MVYLLCWYPCEYDVLTVIKSLLWWCFFYGDAPSVVMFLLWLYPFCDNVPLMMMPRMWCHFYVDIALSSVTCIIKQSCDYCLYNKLLFFISGPLLVPEPDDISPVNGTFSLFRYSYFLNTFIGCLNTYLFRTLFCIY